MTAIFSTLRVRNGRPWFIDDHCRRLGIDIGARAVEAARGLADARVRVTLRAGSEPRIEVEAYAAPESPWALQPVQVSPDGDKVSVKTTDREMYREAKNEAADADDALLHLADGTLLETTIANVFFLFGKRLVTPPAEAPLLAGIARKHVLRACFGLGLEAEEGRIHVDEVRDADACVVTNALVIAHPVREITGIGTYESADLARRLMYAVVPESPQSV